MRQAENMAEFMDERFDHVDSRRLHTADGPVNLLGRAYCASDCYRIVVGSYAAQVVLAPRLGIGSCCMDTIENGDSDQVEVDAGAKVFILGQLLVDAVNRALIPKKSAIALLIPDVCGVRNRARDLSTSDIVSVAIRARERIASGDLEPKLVKRT